MSPRRPVYPEFSTEAEGSAAAARKVVVPDGTGGRILWDKDAYKTLHGPRGAVRGQIKRKKQRCARTVPSQLSCSVVHFRKLRGSIY